MEPICAILAIIISVVVLTVVGHFLWLLFAAIYRAMFGAGVASSDAKNGSPSEMPGGPSKKSGEGPDALIAADLQAAKRLVDYAQFNGWMSPEQLAALRGLIEDYGKRVRSQSSGGASQVSAELPTTAKPTRPSVVAPHVASPSVAAEANAQKPLPPVLAPVHPLDAPEPAGKEPAGKETAIPTSMPSSAVRDTAIDPSRLQDSPAGSKLPPVKPRGVPLSANLMRAFMEQSNIRWIELISASLIVVCSVGLVISLWSTLSATSRYFPSLVFLLATVAVHGAGQYTLRQWKLRSTSRGILHIGLMLIPLAVLVGILLSEREGQLPQLDVMTIAVLAVGTVVYGGAAVTAAKALFAARYLPVAAAVVLGAMTLVPIHFLGASQRLGQPWSAVILAPLVAVVLVTALLFSQTVCRQGTTSSGRSRRMATQVLQILFAALVPIYFWSMRAGGVAAITDATVSALGLMLAGWASWGWTASMAITSRSSSTHSSGAVNPGRLGRQQPLAVPGGGSSVRHAARSSSWLIVLAWGLAFCCSLGLVAILWHTAGSRLVFAGLLLALGAWWMCHGWMCRLFLSYLAGSLSGIVALGLLAEWTVPNAAGQLKSTDWFSLSRIVTLSLAGGMFGAVGAVLLWLQGRSVGTAPLGSAQPSETDRPAALGLSLLSSGGLTLVGTTALTTMASLVPWSSPPYGGNWAPLMMMFSGLIFLAAGYGWAGWSSGESSKQVGPGSLSNWGLALFPVGQAIMLLGAIRFCQSASLAPDWISELRPLRAWSVGAGLVAVTWGLLALGLRLLFGPKDRSSSPQSLTASIGSLNLGGLGLALIAGFCYWTAWDRWELASCWGWVIPATLLLSFLASRASQLREWSVLGTAGWVVTLALHLGLRWGWWEQLGVASSTGLLILAALLVLMIYQGLLRLAPTGESWLTNGPRWVTELLLHCSWLALLISLVLPVGVQLWSSLSPDATQVRPHAFLDAPLDLGGSGIVLLAVVALSVFTLGLRSHRADSLRLWLAVVPLILASLFGCILPVPYCVPGLLAGLAVVLMAMELLTLTKTGWGRRFIEIAQITSKGKWPAPPQQWLALATPISLGALVIGTLFVSGSHAFGRIPQPLSALTDNMATWSGWVVNLVRIAIWMAPLTAVLAVRWFTGLWHSLPARVVIQRGYAVGGIITLASVIAGAALPEQAALLGLQSFALVMVAVSWKTLSFAAAWNCMGLRQLDKQSSWRQLLSKACGGARWRSALEAAWQLWTGSIAAATLLSLAAATLIALYPQVARSELHVLGGIWTLLSVGLAAALWWLLGLQRGMSKFGLLALTLGMLAPIVAASYASWLMTYPNAKIASAANFEPYRLLVGLWLGSLVSGLVIRIHSRLRNEPLTGWGEQAWVGLAMAVGILAILGLNLDSHWASAQLAALAVIIALSAEASGKTWRGWIAAFAATLAWVPWISGGSWSSWIHYPWQALWGGVGVGLISIAARQIFASLQSSSRPKVIVASSLSNWTIDRAACLVVSIGSLALSGLWILQQGNTVAAPTTATWIVAGLMLANGGLAVARLWDAGPSQRGLSFYLAVLATTVVLVNTLASFWELPRMETELAWLCGFLGAMTILAILLREMSLQRLPVQGWLNRRNLATDDKLRSAEHWMAVWHTLAGLVCLLPAVWLVLNIPSAALRMAAIALPMLGAAAILPVSSGAGRAFQRSSVLLLVSATLVLAWWADLPAAWTVRGEDQSWLFVHRTFMALVVLGVAYPWLAWTRTVRLQRSLSRLAPEIPVISLNSKTSDANQDSWTPSLILGGWVCLGLALMVGSGMIVGTGLRFWSDFPVQVSLLVKCLTLIAWAMIFGRLIQAAAKPFSIDRLTDRRSRSALVYIAEVVLVLGGLAAYQHFPNLFSGVFLPWWPLIVFGVAFLSAGIGQVLHRAKQPVLADPIHQSSLLLPIIPLAGVWWAQQDSSAAHWGEWGSYWMLLAAASSLYGLYGWIRSSVWLRTISAGAALLSFWSLLLSRPDLHFLDRPQVWLLPPAVGTLLFVEWNRQKLDATTVTISRYLCILIAYLSSSAEVFLKAVEGNLWQPILLLFLALCGTIAGMWMRVRAFLYCGMTFIMIALFGMVWHAAQAIEQVWPWWVFGIATGVALIVLLGYFEKNRPKVLKYLEELKSWQN